MYFYHSFLYNYVAVYYCMKPHMDVVFMWNKKKAFHLTLTLCIISSGHIGDRKLFQLYKYEALLRR